jgi:murein DD-endopeptidase MepM/ murein hydrolase activator NlpD
VGREPTTLEIEVSDRGAGLRAVRANLIHAGGDVVLLDEAMPGNPITGGSGEERRVTVSIDAQELGLDDGAAFLVIAARDWSWRGGFGGNETRLEIPVRIDTTPPVVRVANGLTYVRRGGSGAALYSVSETTRSDGVRVGDVFYRGYDAPGIEGSRVAFFAVPTDAGENPPIRVVAVDEAGNETAASWSVVFQERVLPRGRVRLPASFLEDKVRPLAVSQNVLEDDLEDAFRRINTEVRSANEARIRELIATSDAERHWQNAFAQLANSKVTSRFAEHRTYFVGETANSEATHFGYDLAATAAAPITASNAGRVVFAGDLGIYGNCILVDHGLGLTSLYGHLSSIEVAAGDAVEQGAILGRSGATGLAGGDHLHFAILVGGTYVDPLEWWDPQWVDSHIDALLQPPTP